MSNDLLSQILGGISQLQSQIGRVNERLEAIENGPQPFTPGSRDFIISPTLSLIHI